MPQRAGYYAVVKYAVDDSPGRKVQALKRSVAECLYIRKDEHGLTGAELETVTEDAIWEVLDSGHS